MSEITEHTQWCRMEDMREFLETNASTLAAVSELTSGAWKDLAALEECQHWMRKERMSKLDNLASQPRRLVWALKNVRPGGKTDWPRLRMDEIIFKGQNMNYLGTNL